MGGSASLLADRDTINLIVFTLEFWNRNAVMFGPLHCCSCELLGFLENVTPRPRRPAHTYTPTRSIIKVHVVSLEQEFGCVRYTALLLGVRILTLRRHFHQSRVHPYIHTGTVYTRKFRVRVYARFADCSLLATPRDHLISELSEVAALCRCELGGGCMIHAHILDICG